MHTLPCAKSALTAVEEVEQIIFGLESGKVAA